MRALLINDDVTREAVNKVIQFAADRKNWYEPPHSRWVPGDRDDYVLKILSYRCVFTYTFMEDKLFRHLSISIPGNNLPNQTAAFTIAYLFGFTGGRLEKNIVVAPGDDWSYINEYRCTIIIQEVHVFNDQEMNHDVCTG